MAEPGSEHLRILNRGPDYLRTRMLNRQPGLFRRRTKSAAEQLAESRALHSQPSDDSAASPNQKIPRTDDVDWAMACPPPSDTPGRQPSLTRPRPKVPAIAAAMEYREDSSDTDKKSNGSSSKLENNGAVGCVSGSSGGVGGGVAGVRRRHRKIISRSRSDLTKRLSNSSDLSELRLSRNSADLERFFNEMGLERDILQPMLHSQYAAATSAGQWLYESVSCIASPDNASVCSGKSLDCCHSDRLAADDIRSFDTMSVVERNARIIKWLGGVKKAAGSASD